MHGAGDLPAVHDALRQLSTLVRTTIAQGEHLVIHGAENSDIAVGDSDDARAPCRGIASNGPISIQSTAGVFILIACMVGS